MAGERIGKTCEALIKVVLNRLKETGVIHEEIFWNQKPDGLTVEPDFSIGEDIDHPTKILLVTHSNSSADSHKKCWRNLGELCEAKTFLSPVPYVMNVIFDSVMKPTLKEVQGAAFDGQLIVGDLPYGSAIQNWVAINDSALPTDQHEKVATLVEYSKSDSDFCHLLDLLENDIKRCLAEKQPDLGHLWELEKLRPKQEAPTYKTTFVRRGISKLLIFEDVDLGIRLYRGRTVRIEDVPDYIYSIGLAKKVIGKATPTDVEILNAVRLLADSTIQALARSVSKNTVLQGWLHQLRHVEDIKFMGIYVKKEFEALCDAVELHDRIVELHNDPDALVAGYDVPASWPPLNVWLISYLIEVIKASSKRSNGYGIAQLANDVVAAGYGSEADLLSAGQFGGGFGFSSWIMRHESPFRDDLIKGVSYVLSEKISRSGYGLIEELIDNRFVEHTMIRNLIETKLCTYREFDPLLSLLSLQVPRHQKKQYRTCFAEKAGVGGQSGKTTVVQVKHTIINWQSATDAGRSHKRNELCGRALGLRYSWDAAQHMFVPRPNVQKLILILDGTWRQSDLNALARAGWDEIYYPDEIAKLKNAII